jgi:hypothetical protein
VETYWSKRAQETEATLVTGRFILRSLVFAALIAISGWGLARNVSAETVCADDMVPKGMAVTETGTTASCAGACRARETQAVCGPVMKICAGQPLPNGYILDSVTTIPACQCLGPEDNAYVIRYVGTRDETNLSSDSNTSSRDSPYVDSEDDTNLDSEGEAKLSREARYPYGDPPFGNFLCSSDATERQPYGNSLPSQSNNMNLGGPQLPLGTSPQQPASPPLWNYQQNEPFRIGQ